MTSLGKGPSASPGAERSTTGLRATEVFQESTQDPASWGPPPSSFGLF